MTPSISVVVPAYNAAPYLERCLSSLFAQQIPVEIIVVNDGSTDDTGRLVRDVVAPRPHVLHLIEQDNHGLSAARNAGIAKASAPYLGLVDGDDWIDADTYGTMVSAADRHAADLVIANGEMIDHLTGATKGFHDDDRFRALAAAHPAAFAPQQVPDLFRLDTSACKRIYRRSFLEAAGFHFMPGMLFEDIQAHYYLLMHATRVHLVDRRFYKYRINHPARITDRRDRQILTVFEILRRSAQVLEQRHASPQIWSSFIWFQAWALRWLASQVDVEYRRQFLKGVIDSGRCFPRAGVIDFRRRFAADDVAQTIVALQRLGCRQTFSRHARHLLTARDHRVAAAALKRFAVEFAG